MDILLGALLIFCARVTDVSMSTIRMILTIRGKRKQAAAIGFFEVIIYVSALGMIVKNLNSWVNLVAYGSGFACGVLLGSKIEEKLALGYVTVQVTISDDHGELADILRGEGFGVTIFDAYGLEGPKKVLNIYAQRKSLHLIHELIQATGQSFFVTVLDTKSSMGGYLKASKKK